MRAGARRKLPAGRLAAAQGASHVGEFEAEHVMRAQAARAAQAPAQGRPRDRWRVARAVGIERFIHDRLGQLPGTRRPHLSVEALGGALRGRLAAVEVFAVERNKRPSAGALSRNNATDQSSAGMIRIALGGCASASPPFRQLTAQRISGFG
jgi:hypothetical protein